MEVIRSVTYASPVIRFTLVPGVSLLDTIRVTFRGSDLEDSRPLSHYGITPDDSVIVARRLRLGSLNVVRCDEFPFPLEIRASDTMGAIKERIFRRYGIEVGSQRLQRNETTLQNHQKLSDWGPGGAAACQHSG